MPKKTKVPRVEPVGAERDEQRGREDDGEPAEIGAGTDALPQGEHEVDADERPGRSLAMLRAKMRQPSSLVTSAPMSW